MSNAKIRFFSLIVVFALLLAPAVSSAQSAKVLRVPNPIGQGDIATLDPALSTDYASGQIIQSIFYVLVRGLETDLNQIQPGMAEKWVVSPDGLTYTFTIRKGISWVRWDGTQVAQVKDAAGAVMNVTAHDFEYGIKRTLDPRTASQYAYVFTTIIKGAAEFNASKETGDALNKLRDAVGVKATDDNTLVITLAEPAGFAINILTLCNLAAQPEAVITQFGDRWTDPSNIITYGPWVMSEWKHDESLTLTKNPFWPGIENSPQPKIDQVVFSLVDQASAFASYEAGSMDVAAVPVSDIDRARTDPTLSKELAIPPVLNSAYYSFNFNKPPFDDVRMRSAFSLAVDRQAIVDNVTKGGQIPARWFSRPGIAAAPTLENSPKLGISYDPEAAQKALQSYLDEKKITVDQLPQIVLTVYQADTVIKVAEAIQRMWKTTLGIDVQVATQEWKVFAANLAADTPQLYALGWTADYADANNFLREVFRSNSGNNYTKWKNDTYDKLVDDAAAETDPAKRLALYQQAEDILVAKDAVIIPLYWGTRLIVTKSYVERTISQINGDERFEKWDIKAH